MFSGISSDDQQNIQLEKYINYTTAALLSLHPDKGVGLVKPRFAFVKYQILFIGERPVHR